jgi:hypothetical protein
MTEEAMERRLFLKSLFGLAGVAVVGALSSGEAHALPIAQPTGPGPQVQPEEAVATPQDIDAAKTEKVQYYYRWRRPRRRYVVRRYYYRPRYVVRRRYFVRRRYW